MSTSSPVEPQPDTLGLRARKKVRTRKAIQSAALELFQDRGFENVTVDDVAVACDMSRATVFRYFPTKDDLLVGRDPDKFEIFRAAFVDRPSDESAFLSVRHALAKMAETYESNAADALAIRRLVADNSTLLARRLELQAEWTETFSGLLAERRGLPAPDLRAKILATAVSATTSVAVDEWLAGGGTTPLLDLLDEAIRLLGEGFADNGS